MRCPLCGELVVGLTKCPVDGFEVEGLSEEPSLDASRLTITSNLHPLGEESGPVRLQSYAEAGVVSFDAPNATTRAAIEDARAGVFDDEEWT